jgi:DNA-binding transcriptional regulator YdaS (Cro superfamily)
VPRYELNLEKLKEAINVAGGVGALSSKSKISYQSIIDWRGGKKSPSHVSCKKIEKATEGAVKAEDILPDYPWEELK